MLQVNSIGWPVVYFCSLPCGQIPFVARVRVYLEIAQKMRWSDGAINCNDKCPARLQELCFCGAEISADNRSRWAAAVFHYLPATAFSKSTGNNFLSAALDLRCVHAQVSARAQSIINQRQVDMSAGPRNGGRLLLFSSALSQCCFTISLERKKATSHFPSAAAKIETTDAARNQR